MIDAVIFDMDGVLIESEGVYLEWILNYSNMEGYNLSKEVLQKTIGLSSVMSAEYFDEILGKGKGQVFWNNFMEKSDSYPFDYKKALNPGALKLLIALKENNIKAGLASASDYREIDAMLDANNLRDYFDVVLSGADFAKSKPSPEIYLTAARKLNVSPECCIVIEDSPYGIEAGKHAGAMVIAIEENRFGFNQSKADYLVKSLNSVWDIVISYIDLL